jgi:hypothetical protein
MIGIVHHTFLTGNWQEILNSQIERLISSGLYDNADIIWFTCNLNGNDENVFTDFLKDYNKIQTECHVNNGAEYPGIHKVKELGDNNEDMKILYFHGKGVSNTYTNNETKEVNEDKVKNIQSWRECLEYFVIDKWKDCVDKLYEYDNVGVTCNGGWYWGNFWWSQSKHIKKCRPVDYWGRWDYEAWLNSYVENQTNYEFFKFTYNPYVTIIHEDWYKKIRTENDPIKITVLNAFYGTPPFEIDEGYSNIPLNVTEDVKSVIEEKLKEQNNEKFYFPVNNESMGCDPSPGNRKFLFIEFYLSNGNNIYKLGLHEGMFFDQKF